MASSPNAVIRPARPEDREAVLAFCQRTWYWGDYLPQVWDEWLAARRGFARVDARAPDLPCVREGLGQAGYVPTFEFDVPLWIFQHEGQ